MNNEYPGYALTKRLYCYNNSFLEWNQIIENQCIFLAYAKNVYFIDFQIWTKFNNATASNATHRKL